MIAMLCPITSRGCALELEQQPIFTALLPSLQKFNVWSDVKLFIGYDSSDPVWSKRSARGAVDCPAEWIELHALTKNLTAIWNWLATDALSKKCDFVLPAGDDVEFLSSPLPAVSRLGERGGFGIIGFRDTEYPELTTFFLAGKKHFSIFGTLYPLPWTGGHQDSWIADVYRPWHASEIDDAFSVRNTVTTGVRTEYGSTAGYREAVAAGRKKIRDYRGEQISDDVLDAAPLCIEAE